MSSSLQRTCSNNIPLDSEQPLDSSVVTLNVGGKLYTTTVDTLTKVDGTFFSAMFSEAWSSHEYDKDGCIFVDRDGKLFRYILNALRTGKVFLNSLSLARAVLEEARFFAMSDLCCDIEAQIEEMEETPVLCRQCKHRSVHVESSNSSHKRRKTTWEFTVNADF